MAIKIEVVNVTPKMAQKWLEKNSKNRAIINNSVKSFSRQMSEGKWVFNGDPIRFDDKGELIDGQHRLEAVIMSGKTIQFVVQKGLSEDARLTIDIGKNRKGSEIWSMTGGAATSVSRSTLAVCEGAARIIYNVVKHVQVDPNTPLSYTHGSKLAPNEIAVMLRMLEGIDESALWAFRNRTLGFPAVLTAFHWIMTHWVEESEFLTMIEGKPSPEVFDIYFFLAKRREGLNSTQANRLDNMYALFYAYDCYMNNKATNYMKKSLVKYPELVVKNAMDFNY